MLLETIVVKLYEMENINYGQFDIVTGSYGVQDLEFIRDLHARPKF